MTTKYCLVSFSSKGRENYNLRMPNLINSAIEHWKGESMFFSPDWTENGTPGNLSHDWKIIKRYPEPKAFKCYTHKEIPYQFKLAAIQEAREAGFTKILWMDTTISFHKNIEPLFELCKEKGVIAFHNLGHNLAHYISDDALEQLGHTAEQANLIPQCWGGIFWIDFENETACKVFDEMVKYSLDGKTFQESGSIRPEFKAHRHDQSCFSILFHKYGIDLLPYGKVVIKQHSVEPFEYGTDFYLIYG